MSSQRAVPVNISEAARQSGISEKKIRHYESISLLPKAPRTSSGYRDFSVSDVHRLRFIRRTRELGMSFERIRTLVGLWDDPDRALSHTKSLALAQISELEQRAQHLTMVIEALRQLVTACNDEQRAAFPAI